MWGGFFALKDSFVGNNGILDCEGPCDDVLEPPAAAGEVVFEAVDVAFVDRATDRQVRSVEDLNGDRQGEKELRLRL